VAIDPHVGAVGVLVDAPVVAVVLGEGQPEAVADEPDNSPAVWVLVP
jgi:hypothetical protein